MSRSDQVYYARENLERTLGFAQSVTVGDTTYFSGVISIDQEGGVVDAGDMAAQIRNVYGELRDLLVAHGLTAEAVVKETVYTTDMNALIAHAPLRIEQIGDHAPPAATWVEVSRLAFPGAMLEVDWTLYRG